MDINIDKCRLQEEGLSGSKGGRTANESITEFFIDEIAEWFAGDEAF